MVDQQNNIADKNDVAAVVIGAGIAGMHAALELAESGCRVILVEKAPAVGGLLAKLDHQFPDDGCGMCRILPMIDRDACRQICLRKGLDHNRITVLTRTEVAAVEGAPGNLNVTLIQNPAGIDPERCTLCGACMDACPVDIPDIFNAGLGRRKAVYFPVPHQADRMAPVIDVTACTRCNACVEACPENAVNLEAESKALVLEKIAGIIYAPGVDLFDPSAVDVYGYGVLPDVVTALAFERMLSGSGPFSGRPVRPSDGGPVQKIAWVQCVGSRNIMIGADYCSSACCMFAVKEAVMAHEKIPGPMETAIFYMDMRTFGRDFQRYRDRAEKETGVRFVRCRIHSIEPIDGEGGVKISYVDGNGGFAEEAFDLAVLSTGRAVGNALPDFAAHEGVFLLDTVPGLTDISASIIAAGTAAGRLLRRMQEKGTAGAVLPQAVNPRSLAADAAAEEAKSRETALFSRKPAYHLVLHGMFESAFPFFDSDAFKAGLSAAGLDIPITRAGGVSCEKGLEDTITEIRASKANRLVIVTAAPHLVKISQWSKWIGLMPSLIRVIDVRPLVLENRSGLNTPELLTAIEMEVGRLRSRSGNAGQQALVEKTALVIGAGPAGLSAALALADLNIRVAVVEKSDGAGGNTAYIHAAEIRESVSALLQRAQQHPLITMYCGASVVSHRGLPGRFVAEIALADGGKEVMAHGAVVLAVGGKPAETNAYGMGSHDNVISQFELERRLYATENAFDPPGSVVMIQCAGSREEPNNYCSRICCAKALSNALILKKQRPDIKIWVFYRDIMTYGDLEKIYTEARAAGVFFIPFDPEQKPSVTVENGTVVVCGRDPVMGEDIRLTPDLVALSTGLIPSSVDDLAAVFGIRVTLDGFIHEADSKWRPMDTGREGIFVAGLCRAPANAREAMAEGEAAAYRAWRILGRTRIGDQRHSARVRHAICSQCELCIEICPYEARYIDLREKKVMVDAAACQGCGACAAVCPNSASVLTDFEDSGIMDAIEAAL